MFFIRSIAGSDTSKTSDGQLRKMDVITRLRASAARAADHKQLAELLGQFMKALGTNRTLTKVRLAWSLAEVMDLLTRLFIGKFRLLRDICS